MEQTYFIWNNRSSKDFSYLVVEKVVISQPEQKNKVISVTNRDGSYLYTSKNQKNRPFFEDRFITISLYFKYATLAEKTNKLSEIMNWFYSVDFSENNKIQVLPDYEDIYFTNANIERFTQVEKASGHVMHIAVQIRCNCLSSYKEVSTNTTEEIDFTNGRVLVKFTNDGFYTGDFKIKLTGGGNYLMLINKTLGIMNDIDAGFTNECLIDFKEKKIYIDNNVISQDVYFFELKPGLNEFVLSSDGQATVSFEVQNKFLYGVPHSGELNSLTYEPYGEVIANG